MTPSATPASERAHETRSRILDVALSEFAAHGLAGARTDRIANTAGVNKALLYYYFESKENLYLAALEMISAKVRDRTLGGLSPRLLHLARESCARPWSTLTASSPSTNFRGSCSRR